MSEQHHDHHGHEHAEEHEHPHFVDEWGTSVVILCGLIFLTALVSFHPYW